MKKLLSVILILGIALAMVACGGASSNVASNTPQSSAPASPQSTGSSQSSSTSAPDSKPTPPSYTKPKYLNMGTATVGGAYYTIGLSMCELLTSKMGITFTAQTTGGATENNTLIQEKELDFALTQASMAYACKQGTTPYESVLDNVVGMIGPITNGVFQVVTLEGSGITKMEDLKGKNIAMGGAGGGTINVANDVWSVLYGFTVDDINPTYSSYTDAVSNLTDGKIDAIIFQTSIPASGVSELMATKGDKVVLIGFTDEEINRITAAYPYYSRYEISAQAYGTKAGCNTICLNNIMVCRKDLEDGLVYDLVKTLIENFSAVQEANPATKLFSIEKAADTVIELHPGAALYYKEIGILK